MSRATNLFSSERDRQVVKEGYTANHDKGHSAELAAAGAQYAMAVSAELNPESPRYDTDPMDWPWHPSHWKPTGDVKLDLVKAGALVAAALDALLDAEDAAREGRKHE